MRNPLLPLQQLGSNLGLLLLSLAFRHRPRVK